MGAGINIRQLEMECWIWSTSLHTLSVSQVTCFPSRHDANSQALKAVLLKGFWKSFLLIISDISTCSNNLGSCKIRWHALTILDEHFETVLYLVLVPCHDLMEKQHNLANLLTCTCSGHDASDTCYSQIGCGPYICWSCTREREKLIWRRIKNEEDLRRGNM